MQLLANTRLLSRRWIPRTAHGTFPPYLEDSWRVTAAALSRRLNVMLLPRQLVYASPNDPVLGADESTRSVIEFAKGVPGSTTLASATYLMDKRATRVLLQAAGVPPTIGTTFAFIQTRTAVNYAEQIGYPVAIRLSMEASRSDPLIARSSRSLTANIEKLQRVPVERGASASSLLLAPYALTESRRFTLDEDGHELYSPKLRFLLQMWSSGNRYRVLAIDGKIAGSAVTSGQQRNRWQAAGTLPPAVENRVNAAMEVMPGAGCLSVELLDLRSDRPERTVGFVITDLSERPRLDIFAQANQMLAHRLADMLVEREAARNQLELQHAQTTVAVEAVIHGAGDDVALQSTVRALGSTLSVAGWRHYRDDNRSDVAISGTPIDVATFAELLMTLPNAGDRPVSIELTHNG